MTDPKRERLEGIAESLRARFGDHAVIHKPSGTHLPPALSTGFPRLDRLLGAGGVPCGGISLFEGIPTSGATTLALRTLAGAAGSPLAYFDLSCTFDPDYAARCGVDVPNLLVVRPPDLPIALEAFVSLAEALRAAVFDLSLLPPLPTPERALWRRLVHMVSRSSCALILLEAGNAPFVRDDAGLWLRVRHGHWLRRRQEVRGLRAEVEIIRDPFGAPGKRVGLTLGGMGWG